MRGGFGPKRLRRSPVDRPRFAFDHAAACGLAFRDRDSARLHGFRQLALQVDVKQAVLERGSRDLDILGEAEPALEVARGDALMNVLANLVLALLFTVDCQRTFFDLKRKVVVSEACDGHRNPVAVLAKAFDVIGRETVLGIEA